MRFDADLSANGEPAAGDGAGAPGFDTGRTPADRMRTHAGQRGHLYAVLMRAMADDWEAGGPVREIWRGWENAPAGSVVQLRLLAGLFRIVLAGRAPELAVYYACVGGEAPPEGVWPVARQVMAANVEELHAALEIAPQTNEVLRSLGLLIGIFDVVGRSGLSRIRLLEPGASAGLNLLVDRFRFVTDTWSYGPVDSRLTLAEGVVGPVAPVGFEIVSRRGCDLSPVDPTSTEGRLRLRSFVWPFQVERHHRLSGALEIASAHPVTVDLAPAADWLETQLDVEPADDVVTVVWHSISRLYWPAGETERVLDAVASARQRIPVAHIWMEYPRRVGDDSPELVVDGPTPGPARRLGTIGDHGGPVTIETAVQH